MCPGVDFYDEQGHSIDISHAAKSKASATGMLTTQSRHASAVATASTLGYSNPAKPISTSYRVVVRGLVESNLVFALGWSRPGKVDR